MKNTLRPFLLFGTLFLGTALLLGSCKKHTVVPTPAPSTTPTTTPLKINSFGPDSGALGSTVVIHGAGFGKTIADISVKFSGITATATAITDSTLTVTVPIIHAGDGKISVQAGTQNVTSTTDFKYLYTVTALAGDTTGSSGHVNATGGAARFDYPIGLTTDATGNVYVADFYNSIIRMVTPAGVVSDFAGDGTPGFKDDPVPTAAWFNRPTGITMGTGGNFYVADYGNGRIRKINAVSGVASSAALGIPIRGIAVDAAGNIYTAHSSGNVILKISPTFVVNTFAGDGTAGFKNATATAAEFNNPLDMAADATGNIYVADRDNNMIRKITPAGLVSTVAGSVTSGFSNGNATTALFNNPSGIAIDAAGNIYVADTKNYRIRKITPAGIVITFAGDGNIGLRNGIGTKAQFRYPSSVTVDAAGNIYVSDSGGNNIRKLQ